ncbi:hypothetical protein, partial [Citrobacter freundii]|uniref:hypothetical protein n=1 Tax=Citrobacter freundii TaxID=546 RepID=UPI0023B10199
DALRMNMMISYQELVRTFPNGILGLTKYQWEALWLSFIGVEIKEIAEKTGRTPPTLYAHRKAGLNYLKLNHLHEFKNVIASF